MNTATNPGSAIHSLLTPENCTMIFIDHQPQMTFGVTSIDRQTLTNNVVGLAKAARIFNVPVILTTVETKSFSGYIWPELLGVFPDHQPVERSSMNSWEDEKFVAAVKATGRKKLIMTALWTEACLTFPALDAMREGFEVYVVADAVGGTSVGAHEAALRRIEQAGGQLISKTQLYCELQRDWARSATVPGFMDVFESWDGFNPEKSFKG